MAEPRFLVELHEASWNGAFFFPLRAGKEGGHDDSFKKIASSDRAIIEQLGRKSPVFTIGGTIAARRSRDGSIYFTYEQMRDAWEEACDTPGIGVLVHPTRGKLENIVLRTYRIDEDFGGIGEAAISMTFGRTDEKGVPFVEGPSIPKTAALTLTAGDTAQRSLEENHKITSTNTGNLESSVAKVGDETDGEADTTLIGKFNAGVAKVKSTTSKLQGYQQEVSQFSADVVSIVQDGIAFADSVRSLYNAVRGLAPTFEGSYQTLKNMTDFGDGDTPSGITTSGRAERELNRTTLNNYVQATALAEAMEAASKIDFQTVEEIDEVAGFLGDVYTKLSNRDGFDRDTLAALSALRVEVSRLFAEKKLTAKRIITVDVDRGTPAQISYRYYGNLDNVDLILELNGLRNGDPIEGEIRMLTE